MSMRMTRDDLEALIKTLDALDAVPAEIKQVTVNGHSVFLDRRDDARGVEYVVCGITDKVSNAPAIRDGR